MALNLLANLDPRTALARAEVRHVGPGWDLPSRAASGVNIAFDTPPGPQPSSPSAPQPTEAELRDRLREAVERQSKAADAAEKAHTAHERAMVHVAKCRQALAGHIALDQEIAEHTLASLKEDVDPKLPDDLAAKLIARDRAKTDLLAAEGALAALTRELAQASQTAGDAAKEVDILVTKVLAFTAEAIAGDHARLLAEAAARRKALHAYDRIATARKVGLPFAVQHALNASDVDGFRSPDLTPWQQAERELHADPHATITITLPEPVIPQVPQPVLHTLTMAPGRVLPQDDGDPHLIEADATP
jgi:hypothetical protein